MCKIDITAAYRCIPVRPADFHLLGMKWKGCYDYDKCLPFGLCSSCAIFEWYSTAAEWIVKHWSRSMVKWLTHYIDDFFLVARTQSQATAQLRFLLGVFQQLGLPVSPEKLEGPSQTITFLGIEIDSITMEARLPKDKLDTLSSTISEWLTKTTATQRELQSLIGQLNFACKVVRSGRSFLRRLIDTASAAPSPECAIPISPTSPLRLDLNWWHHFLSRWNGTTILLPPRPRQPSITIYTDACNTGYGAALVQRNQPTRWLHGRWSSTQLEDARRKSRISMPYLEMLAVVISLSSWASLLSNTHIALQCDCKPVVYALQPQHYTSSSPGLMSCIRTILYLTATHNIQLRIAHLAGIDNSLADALSRDQIPEFKRLCPDSLPSADIPAPLPTHNW